MTLLHQLQSLLAREMTSERALEILREQFPGAAIEECDGNPSITGWFLYRVNDVPVFVTQDGEVVI